MIHKIHLNLPGGSKRGVKLREIDTKARELAQVTVAKKLGGGVGVTMVEYEQALARECLCMMIAGVTEKPVDEAGLLAKTGWKKLTYVELTASDGAYNFLKLFSNPKDAGVLTAFYNKTCVVLQSEVDAILGKAIAVDEDE